MQESAERAPRLNSSESLTQFLQAYRRESERETVEQRAN